MLGLKLNHVSKSVPWYVKNAMHFVKLPNYKRALQNMFFSYLIIWTGLSESQ